MVVVVREWRACAWMDHGQGGEWGGGGGGGGGDNGDGGEGGWRIGVGERRTYEFSRPTRTTSSFLV